MAKLCQPYNGEDLVWHKVDPAMGSVKVQGPNCSKPLSRPSAASFFKPHKPTTKLKDTTGGVLDGAGFTTEAAADAEGACTVHALCVAASPR